MQALGVAISIVGHDALSGPANAAGMALTGLEKTAGVVGSALGGLERTAVAVGVAVTAMGAAITATVAVGVKQASDLQQAVSNISSIKPTIDSSGVFSSLNLMQTRVAASAKDMGAALYNVFSSIETGARQGLALVEKFAKGAVASITDASTFGTAILGELNAFKLGVAQTDHLMDVFFNTVKVGVVTGQELAANLGLVAQSARTAGVDVDQLGGFIAGVTKEGGSAAQNINNLNNLLQKVTTKEAAAGFKEIGVQVVDSTGKFRPLLDVLTDTRATLVNYTQSAAAAALQKIFPDLQARQGALVIMNELDTVRAAIEENQNSTGAATEAYEKMVNTFENQSKLLRQTFDSVLTSVGAAAMPVLQSVTTGVQKFVADTAPMWDTWQTRIQNAFKKGGFDAWLKEVGAVAGELGKQIELWIPPFTGWVDRAKDKLGTTLREVYDGTIVPWVTQRAQDLKAKFETEWVPALVDWWKSGETQDKVKGAMDAMGDKVKEWAGEGGSGNAMFKEAGASLGNALLDGVKEQLAGPREWLDNFGRSFENALRGSQGFSTNPPPQNGPPPPVPAPPPRAPAAGGFAAFPVQGYRGGTVANHWSGPGIPGSPGGADLFADRGTPVVAANAGQVIDAGYSSIGGNYVLIAGPNGMQYYYAHLDQAPLVSNGQQVTGGQRIGSVGNTGNASTTAPHLHFGAGFGIQNGGGPTGGTGLDFDAVAALNTALAGGAGPVDYHALARAFATQYGVDPDIYEAMIQHEHGFKTDLTPNAQGAKGIAQFMPLTGASIANQLGLTEAQFYSDPKNQLQGGALYLSQLQAQFGGDPAKALTAYNWGPGNVMGGGTAPGSTQKYVADILAEAGAAKDRRPRHGSTLSVPNLSPAEMAALTGGPTSDGGDTTPAGTPRDEIGGGTYDPRILTPEKLAAAFGGAEAEAAAGTRGRALIRAFDDAVENEKPHALEILGAAMADLKQALLNDPQLSPEEALARYSEVLGAVNTALLDGSDEAIATARTQMTAFEQALSIDKIQDAAEKKRAALQKAADAAIATAEAARDKAIASMTTTRESAIADREAEQAESDRIAKAVEGAKLYVKAQEDQLAATIDAQKQIRQQQQETAALELKFQEDVAAFQTKKRATDTSGVLAPTYHADPQADLNRQIRDAKTAHDIDVFNLNQRQQIAAANHAQDVAWKLEETALASTLKATILDPTAETARKTSQDWKDAYAFTVQIPRDAAAKWTETETAVTKIKNELGTALQTVDDDATTALSRITAMSAPTGLPATKELADQAFDKAASDTDRMLQNILAINVAQGNAPGYTTGTASGSPNNGSTGGSVQPPKGPTPGGPGMPSKDGDPTGAEFATGMAMAAFGSESTPLITPPVDTRPLVDQVTDAMRQTMANSMIDEANAAAAANPAIRAITKSLGDHNFGALQQLELKPPPPSDPLPVYIMNPSMGLGASGMFSGAGVPYSPIVHPSAFSPAPLPHFAGGVHGFSGGWAMVGEQGPEPVYLPAGSNVYPHGSSAGGGRGLSDRDIDRLVAALERARFSLDGRAFADNNRTQQRAFLQSNLPNGVGGI